MVLSKVSEQIEIQSSFELTSQEMLIPSLLLYGSSMACGALFRRGFIEENKFALDHPRQLVASRAAHCAMCTLQGERGSRIVVEQ
jgi:hypothetical protein